MFHSHDRIPVKETIDYRNFHSENLEYKSKGNIIFLYKNIYFCLILIFNDRVKIKVIVSSKNPIVLTTCITISLYN